MRLRAIPVVLAILVLGGLAMGAAAAKPGARNRPVVTKSEPALPEEPGPAIGPAATPEELYTRLSQLYITDGDLGTAARLLRASQPLVPRLSPAQQADVAYLKTALAECRPAWWHACKAGQKTPMQAMLWGKPFQTTFDPSIKGGMKIEYVGKLPVVTVAWPAGEMDSTDSAEYGFLKGDVCNYGAWATLGLSAAYASIPVDGLRNLSEKDNLRVNLYMDFRGNLAALMYASPPARRWGLHIFLAAYMPQYGKGPAGAARRAAASMFMAEVLKAPEKYPSLALPKSLEAEGAEEKLAVFFKFNRSQRKTAWTIAEDKAFREALKTFAAANDLPVLQTGRVSLPNGLAYSLVAEEDETLRPRRDAWVKEQFDKAAAK